MIETLKNIAPMVCRYIMAAWLGWFAGVFDKVKIGKLNYHPSNINWKSFGCEAERLCRKLGLDYTIKESLRREMEKP